MVSEPNFQFISRPVSRGAKIHQPILLDIDYSEVEMRVNQLKEKDGKMKEEEEFLALMKKINQFINPPWYHFWNPWSGWKGGLLLVAILLSGMQLLQLLARLLAHLTVYLLLHNG